MSLTAQAFSSGAVTGTVTLGGPCVFTALYTYIPIGEFAQVVLALTAVYQAVALAPASATQLAVQYGQLGSYSPGAGLLPSNATIMNNDTAIANVVFRLTRGAFVNEVTLGNIAARSRNSISPVLPALILGDVLEVKALTAPVVPGSVVLRFPYLRVPLQS
jgi:hypothetical protein